MSSNWLNFLEALDRQLIFPDSVWGDLLCFDGGEQTEDCSEIYVPNPTHIRSKIEYKSVDSLYDGDTYTFRTSSSSSSTVKRSPFAYHLFLECKRSSDLVGRDRVVGR